MSLDDEKEQQALMNYAAKYLESGKHDNKKIKEILEKYPLVTQVFEGKTGRRLSLEKNLAGMFASDTAINRKGDQILYYTGLQYPDFPKMICNDFYEKFKENPQKIDEKTFVDTMKFVNRLGYPELVGVMIKDYIEKNAIDAKFGEVFSATVLKDAYQHLKENGFKEKPDFFADPRPTFFPKQK